MKDTRAICLLCSALLLTACSGQQDSEISEHTQTASGTVSSLYETTAVSETVSGAVTAFTGSTTMTGTTVLSSVSGNVMSSTAQTSAAGMTTESTAAVSEQKTTAVQAEVTSASAQKAAGTTAPGTSVKPAQTTVGQAAGGSQTSQQGTALLPEQLAVVDALFKAHQSGKTEDFTAVTNIEDFVALVDLYQDLYGSLFSDGFKLEDVLQGVVEKNLASYTIAYSAKRPDMLEMYRTELNEAKKDIEDSGSPEEKAKMQKAFEMLDSVTEVWSVELNCTKKDGSEKVIGVPLFCRNGEWKADLFLCRFMSVPVTREEVRKKQMETAKTAWRAINRAFSSLAQKDATMYGVLEGRVFTWKGETLKNIKQPSGDLKDDPMENLRYQAHKRNNELDQLQEIRFYLDNGQCTAAACLDADGVISYYPIEDIYAEASSVEDALTKARKIAEKG